MENDITIRWKHYLDTIQETQFVDSLRKCQTLNTEQNPINLKDCEFALEEMKKMYKIFHPEAKFKKVHISHKNNWRIMQVCKFISNAFSQIETTKRETYKYVLARNIYYHLNILFNEFENKK